MLRRHRLASDTPYRCPENPEVCISRIAARRPTTRIASVATGCEYNVSYLSDFLEKYGLGSRWSYWCGLDDTWHGLSRDRVRRLYAEADAIVNLCGSHNLRDEHLQCPVRILIDTDPGYQQIHYAKGDSGERAYLAAHTHFFTYGANFGRPECPIPQADLDWRPTRPPVDVDLWPEPAAGPERGPDCFTSIASWDNRGKDIEYQGSTYLWSKHVLLKFRPAASSAGDRNRMAIQRPAAASAARSRRRLECHHFSAISRLQDFIASRQIYNQG